MAWLRTEVLIAPLRAQQPGEPHHNLPAVAMCAGLQGLLIYFISLLDRVDQLGDFLFGEVFQRVVRENAEVSVGLGVLDHVVQRSAGQLQRLK